jgi:hypothetical protein
MSNYQDQGVSVYVAKTKKKKGKVEDQAHRGGAGGA